MKLELVDKQDALLKVLESCGRVAVAFSGGVDSSVVAKAAAIACGENAVAVTADSFSLAEGELDLTRALAAQIGIRHEIIQTGEFDHPEYQANAGNRCYFCKSELYQRIVPLLALWDVDVICNGANLDDLGDHRPGMLAAQEYRVRSPLIEAGLTKQDVRELARAWGLPNWDKPAAPCLSSRIAYGVEVTPERVQRVDQAESFLRERFDLREFRVRLEQNDLARIEVPLDFLPALSAEENRRCVVDRFRELGFRSVTLDLEGFRSGNLNSVLPLVSLQTSFQSPATGSS